MIQSRYIVAWILGLVFFFLIYPFIVPLFMGVAVAVLVAPIYQRLQRRKNKSEWHALLVTFSVFAVVLAPVSLLAISLFRNAVGSLSSLKSSADSGTFQRFLELPWSNKILQKASVLFQMEPYEVMETASDGLKKVGLMIADFLGATLAALPSLTVAFVLLVLTIYFALADGNKVVRFLRRHSPFSDTETEDLFKKFTGLCRAVLLASLVSGVAQSFIFLVGMAIASTNDPAFFALLVFFSSFIPVVGASPVTFGLALHTLIVSPTKTPGILLLVFAVVTTMVDNLIRPVVLKGGANLHPLIGLIGLFGGLKFFGFSGIFIGPIIAGLFLTTLSIVVKE